MYRRPLRSDEIYHSWLSKGAQKKNHKYIARINLGDKFRYFYDMAQLAAYNAAKAGGQAVDKVQDAAKNIYDYKITGQGYKRDAKALRREAGKQVKEMYDRKRDAINAHSEQDSPRYRNTSQEMRNHIDAVASAYDLRSRPGYYENYIYNLNQEARENDEKYKTKSIKGISESVAKKAKKFLSKFFDNNKSTSWNDPRPKKFTEDIITEDIITEKKIPEKRITEKKIPEKRITTWDDAKTWENVNEQTYPETKPKNGKRKKKRK